MGGIPDFYVVWDKLITCRYIYKVGVGNMRISFSTTTEALMRHYGPRLVIQTRSDRRPNNIIYIRMSMSGERSELFGLHRGRRRRPLYILLIECPIVTATLTFGQS